jgi:hypothetical protein
LAIVRDCSHVQILCYGLGLLLVRIQSHVEKRLCCVYHGGLDGGIRDTRLAIDVTCGAPRVVSICWRR